MIKIIIIAVATLLLVVFSKNYNKTFSLIIVVSACILIFFQILNGLTTVFDSIKNLSDGIEPISQYIKLMIKVLGITLISQFVSDLCRDSGENALANIVEISSKIIVIVMILPLFETILKIVTGLIV